MQFFRKLLALVLCVGGVVYAGTAAYIYSYVDPDPVPEAAAIVVLSGPTITGTELLGETRERTDRGIALWKAGVAPVLVMTGGSPNPEKPAMAVNMAAVARASGVGSDAILTEPRAHSTLQNAWFTAELAGIDPSEPIVVVTHRYHLPRAWASFRWAGFKDVTLMAPDSGPMEITTAFLAEGIKWPLNIARAVGAEAALFAGTAEADVLPWLE